MAKVPGGAKLLMLVCGLRDSLDLRSECGFGAKNDLDLLLFERRLLMLLRMPLSLQLRAFSSTELPLIGCSIANF